MLTQQLHEHTWIKCKVSKVEVGTVIAGTAIDSTKPRDKLQVLIATCINLIIWGLVTALCDIGFRFGFGCLGYYRVQVLANRSRL